MIAGRRTHELKLGTVREFLAPYEKEARAQKEHFGNLVGSDVGNASEFAKMRAGENLVVRTERRPAIAPDTAARSYLQKSRE